jgi:DNA-binding HxlR family transcriptional regulator
VDSFRYEQFCPLARATEILGHRWVMLILRELFVGPQRFSDLRRRLPGLSSSMLSGRLADLEGQGVVVRRTLEPPAASTVYELTADGQALEPALLALTRWGARFLSSSKPDDHVEPDWLGLGVAAFSSTRPSPARRFELRPYQDERQARLRVAGGAEGTHAIEDELPVDLTIEAPVVVMMGLMRGAIPPQTAIDLGGVRIDGAHDALPDLPLLFDFSDAFDATSGELRPQPSPPKGNSP